MESFFLSFTVEVLHRTNIYVKMNNYNYIKVEPLIPYTFMLSLGYKSQHAICSQDLDMFFPQNLSSLKYTTPLYFYTSLTLAHANWAYHPTFL